MFWAQIPLRSKVCDIPVADPRFPTGARRSSGDERHQPFFCQILQIKHVIEKKWSMGWRLLWVSKARVDPLTCLLHHLCAMNSSDSPLVRHLLTSWRPAWQPCSLDSRLNFNCSFQVDASGECTVEYKVHGNHITKHKSDCRNLEIARQFYNVNPVSTGVTVSNTPPPN